MLCILLPVGLQLIFTIQYYPVAVLKRENTQLDLALKKGEYKIQMFQKVTFENQFLLGKLTATRRWKMMEHDQQCQAIKVAGDTCHTQKVSVEYICLEWIFITVALSWSIFCFSFYHFAHCLLSYLRIMHLSTTLSLFVMIFLFKTVCLRENESNYDKTCNETIVRTDGI